MEESICIIMGGGGHSAEINHIIETSSIKKKIIYIYSEHKTIVRKNNTTNYYCLRRPTCVGEAYNPIKILISAFQSLILAFRLRRSTGVVCNGPAVCIFFSFFMKYLFKARIIYVESIARRTSLSLTGKIMLYFADAFIVQSRLLMFNRKMIYHNFFFED